MITDTLLGYAGVKEFVQEHVGSLFSLSISDDPRHVQVDEAVDLLDRLVELPVW